MSIIKIKDSLLGERCRCIDMLQEELAQVKRNYAIAVAASLFGNLNLSFVNVLISKLPYEISSYRLFFFQLIFGLIFISPWVFRRGISVFQTRQYKQHMIRGIVAVCSIIFFYISLRLLPPVDAVLLKSTTPFFVPFLSMIWLKEKIPLVTWPLILSGFAGVYLIIGPFGEKFSLDHLYPLVAAVGYGYIVVSVNKLRQTDTPEQILLFYFMTAIGFLAPVVLFNWEPIPMALWAILAVLGLLYGIGQIFIVLAYSFSKPGRLAPFIFAEVLFTYLILEIVFGVSLQVREMWGGAIIIGSALVMFWTITRAKALSPE